MGLFRDISQDCFIALELYIFRLSFEPYALAPFYYSFQASLNAILLTL
jgi:hypothetical protein